MKKKFILLSIVLIILISILTAAFLPHIIAVNSFNQKFAQLKMDNEYLQSYIQLLQIDIDSAKEPLSEQDLISAKEVISNAQTQCVSVPEMPKKTSEIKKLVEEFNTDVDYSALISQLQEETEKLNKSFENARLLTNPSEEYVISALKNVDEILLVEAATEENDPNEKLHKKGGYTSAVFFASANAPSNQKTGHPVDDGTDGGGCIEVYENKEDANSRNEYLSAFDGSIFDSGSHNVYGSVIIRTSTHLTATNQKLLEEKILSALCSK